LSVSGYAIMFSFLYEYVGLWGVPLSYLFAVIVISLPVLLVLRKCQKVVPTQISNETKFEILQQLDEQQQVTNENDTPLDHVTELEEIDRE